MLRRARITPGELYVLSFVAGVLEMTKPASAVKPVAPRFESPGRLFSGKSDDYDRLSWVVEDVEIGSHEHRVHCQVG